MAAFCLLWERLLSSLANPDGEIGVGLVPEAVETAD